MYEQWLNSMRSNVFRLIALLIWSALLFGCAPNKNEVDYIKLAEFYLDQGNDKSALEILKNYLQSNSNNSVPYRMIGTIYNSAEFFDDAIPHFQSAIDLGCGQICSEGLIDAYLGRKDIALAELELSNSILDKDSEGVKYRLILLDFDKNRDHNSTISQLKLINLPAAKNKILALMFELGRFTDIKASYSPNTNYSDEQLLVFAKAHYALMNYKTTEDILLTLNSQRKSRLLTKKRIEAIDLLVKTNTSLNKFRDAELIYNSFLKNNEGTSYVTFQNALTQLGDRNFEGAINEINELGKDGLENSQITQALAMAHFGKKDYQSVMDKLEPLKHKLSAQSLIFLATAYNKLKRPQDAINLLQNVEKNKFVKLVLARSYLLKRDDKNAIAIIDSISRDEKNDAFNTKLANIWFELNLYNKIISNFSAKNSFPIGLKYLVVNSYLKLKQESDARQYILNEQDMEQSLELLGFLEASTGNFTTAINIFKDLLQNKRSKKSYFLLASAQLSDMDTSGSLQTIQEGVELDGGNQGLLALANYLLEEHDHLETFRWLNSIPVEHPEFKKIQVLLATYELDRDLTEDVQRRLTPLMKGADHEIYFLMAKAKYEENRVESIQLMEKSLEVKFSLKAALLRHEDFLRQDNLPGLNRMNQMIEQHAGINERTVGVLSRGYLKHGQFKKTSNLAKVMLTLGRKDIAQELSGDVFFGQGEFSKAADAYRQIMDKKAVEPVSLKYFTALFAEESRPTMDVYEEAELLLKENPYMDTLRKFIGVNYIGINSQAAIKHFRLLLDSYPTDIMLLNNLAWVSLDSNPVSALEYSEKAYLINSDNEAVLDTYLRALLKNNQSIKAKELIEAKLKISPDNQNLQKLLRGIKQG